MSPKTGPRQSRAICGQQTTSRPRRRPLVVVRTLSGDLSQINYLSGRMGWIEFQRSIDAWRWRMFIPQFCARVAD